MKKMIQNAVKYFLFMFFVIEVIPYLVNGGDLMEIGLQTIVIAAFSIVISVVGSREKMKRRK